MSSKLAIAIDLDGLERLMKTYVAECVDEDEQLLESVRFSTFLAWLSNRHQRLADQQPIDVQD